MLDVLANRTYRHLFLAQIIALLGTGLLTVALGLLAFELAGERAGAVLGTALAIKMVAYVTVAPVVGAYAAQLPRRAFLIAIDLVRAAIALLLPFVSEVWQIYVLIFLLQSASAAFTPTFQATIPDVLPEEADYTRALSLSRLAYDFESSGGAVAHPDQLPLAVLRDGSRLPVLGRPRPVGGPARFAGRPARHPRIVVETPYSLTIAILAAQSLGLGLVNPSSSQIA